MATADPTDLCGRVNALIDRYFGGNRTKAAAVWRVPQPTVQRMAAGQTTTARATSLARIAETHDTTIDWLMSGRGPNPFSNDPLPYIEYRDFKDLVDSLKLSPETHAAVLDLPKPISTAHTILCQWGMFLTDPPAEQPERVVATSRDAKYQASALQYASWAYLFDGMIKAYGKERVREKLESEVRRVRLGFHPVPLNLFWLPEGRTALDALEKWVSRPGSRSGSVVFMDYPAITPLDGIRARGRETEARATGEASASKGVRRVATARGIIFSERNGGIFRQRSTGKSGSRSVVSRRVNGTRWGFDLSALPSICPLVGPPAAHCFTEFKAPSIISLGTQAPPGPRVYRRRGHRLALGITFRR